MLRSEGRELSFLGGSDAIKREGTHGKHPETEGRIANSFIWVVSIACIFGLAGLGARAGGADMLKPSLRVVFWGAIAMLLAAVIGSLVGRAVYRARMPDRQLVYRVPLRGDTGPSPASRHRRDSVTGEDDPMYARCHELRSEIVFFRQRPFVPGG
jgi:hypothetical protein